MSIDVRVTGGIADLRGCSMEIAFDGELLTPTSVQPGPLLTQADCGAFFAWVNEQDSFDTVLLDAATLGCSVEGDGILFTVVFSTSSGGGEGSSPLSLPSVELRDAQNMSIAHSKTVGSLDVVCPVSSSAVDMTTLKSTFR